VWCHIKNGWDLPSPICILTPYHRDVKVWMWAQWFGLAPTEQALMEVINCHHYNSEAALGGYHLLCRLTGAILDRNMDRHLWVLKWGFSGMAPLALSSGMWWNSDWIQSLMGLCWIKTESLQILFFSLSPNLPLHAHNWISGESFWQILDSKYL